MTGTRGRAAAGGVLGLVAATVLLSSPLMEGSAQAAPCQESFSKYAGTYCIPPVSNKVKKAEATVFFACMFGSLAGTPVGTATGCAGGVVGVLVDAAWGDP